MTDVLILPGMRRSENALRNVVEKSVGVLVTSTTQVEDFEVKLDTILAESRGFINSYEVVSEERQGDTFKITIEADVGLGKLKNKWQLLILSCCESPSLD